MTSANPLSFTTETNPQDRLLLLGVASAENPKDPEIYQGAFFHVMQRATGLLVATREPETELGILGFGLTWKGYDQNLLRRGTDPGDFLSPAEEIDRLASQAYLEATWEVMPAIAKVSKQLRSEPNWNIINKVVKQNLRATTNGNPRRFLEKVRNDIDWNQVLDL